MKIKIKQLFDEITKQKVYPLTTLKAVRDPSTKKSLAELLLVGEDVGETQDTPTKDADTLGGKYRASDIDKSMTYDEDESTEVVENVEIVDADRLGGKYTASDIDTIKQDITGLNSSLSDNTTSESFNYGVKDGVRGFFTNPSKADDSFIPFSSKEQSVAELLDALQYSEFELNDSMTWEDIMNYFKTLYPDHYTLVSRTQNINLLGSCSTRTNYDVTSISGGFNTTNGLYFTSTSKGGGYQNQSHGFCFNSPFDVTKYKSMTVKITTWSGGATGLGLRNVNTPNYGSNVVATIPSGIGTKTIDISGLSGNMYLGLSADVGCTVYIDSIELYP